MTALRVAFAGTPEFARSALQALLGSRHPVVGVFTRPDRPRGRGQRVSASPVKEAALAADVPVLQPPTLQGGAALDVLTRLPEHPRLAPAALARRGADSTGAARRGRNDRDHAHADGGCA